MTPITRDERKRRARRTFSSGAKWEAIVGYSRAVRVGDFIHVSGTTALDDHGNLVGPRDAYAQTRRALDNIEVALQALGGRIEDVVRTRLFVTDISQWPEVGRAHGERFRRVRPAATMVEVRRLIEPGMMVEIEVDAQLSPAGEPKDRAGYPGVRSRRKSRRA